MINRISYYISPDTDPYRNIATEKLLLDTVRDDECILYLWQNKNTVVIGRNQNAWAECRTSLLEQDGGYLARRLSGGGAVFHDLGNLNFTFLMAEDNYDLGKQLLVIEKACRTLAIAAERSGRNDILANGCKFSGNAFYHHGGRSYHHGTLLIDTDMDRLTRYLSPPKAKLEAKGVASVRSRVINLKQLCPGLTCAQMQKQMLCAFASVYCADAARIDLTSEQQKNIIQQAKEFASWDWLYGKKQAFSFACEERFAWGHISVQLQLQSGRIECVRVFTDSMDWSLAEKVETALLGCRFTYTQIESRLQNLPEANDICRMFARTI